MNLNGLVNMKKKIFIFSHAMEIGGAERALIEMLNCFDYDRFEVDLFLLRHCGNWMKEIPNQVNLLPEIKPYSDLFCPIVEALKDCKFGVALGRLFGKFKAYFFAKNHHHKESVTAIEYSHKYTKKFMPKINPNVEYDLAISFLTPHYFVAEKVNAKKKIAWIHTDYSTVDLDVESEKEMWDKYDYIASISDDCTKGFIKVFPDLKNRIVLIENLLSTQTVHKGASDEFENEYDRSTDSQILLTIGRFSPPKKLEDIPEICRKLIDKGLNVKWYIIGYGGLEDLIKSKIDEYKVTDSVIILGKKENPYPYIKNCDVYIQPSRYEGKSVTVREAQMLGKPVIITNYPTAQSQLTDGYDGIIVPMDIEGCVNGIAKVINNKELLNTVAQNTKKVDYTNKAELEKLYKLIGE